MEVDTTDNAVRHALPYSEQAANIVRRMILSGEVGPGERLNEVALATSLGISRSPIREGLQRLGEEGLIVHHKGRGAFVVEFSRADLQELLELREAFDVLGTRLATERASDEEIAGMDETITAAVSAHQHHDDGSISWKKDFHLRILRCSGNTRLYARGSEVHRQLRLVRFRSASTADRAQAAFEEHKQILEAINQRDAERAQDLMREHLAHASSFIVKAAGY